jgi:hypothetical protein
MKPSISLRIVLAHALAGIFVLAGCATGSGSRDADKLALYRAHAGAPVPSFREYGRISGWTPLGDSAVAVWTRPGEAWLLELHGPCQGLEYTPVIALTGNTGRVYARFDKVLVRNTGTIDIPCAIATIRPLDVKAIREAERVARANAQASGT